MLHFQCAHTNSAALFGAAARTTIFLNPSGQQRLTIADGANGSGTFFAENKQTALSPTGTSPRIIRTYLALLSESTQGSSRVRSDQRENDKGNLIKLRTSIWSFRGYARFAKQTLTGSGHRTHRLTARWGPMTSSATGF